MRVSHRILGNVAMAIVLWLASGCGGQGPAGTPDVTGTALQAATEIASMPTAEDLTPRPTRTPEPTQTPMVPSSTPAPTATEAPSIEYTVQAGDTLLSIALAHKVSMAAIMLLNDMGDSQVVKLGQMLKIPGTLLWPGENVFWFVYIVQPGEALSTLASRFGVKIDDLVRVNQLADAGAIRIGQKLVIPAIAPARLPDVPQPTATARPHAEVVPAVPEDTPAPAVVEVAQATPEATAAPAPVNSNRAMAGPDAVTDDIESSRAEILALYNQARSAAGLAPLASSPLLQQTAQGHAEDCALRGYGSHTGSDGADLRARLSRLGYPGRIAGENWAWGPTAQHVFDAWFTQEDESGPHRSNILSPRYTEVGFGIAAARGGYYFIADFGAP